MQLPLPQHVDYVLAADEARKVNAAGRQAPDGLLEGLLDALDDELPAYDDEVVEVLLKKTLKSELVSLLDKHVDTFMGIHLKHLGNVGLNSMIFDFPIDG